MPTPDHNTMLSSILSATYHSPPGTQITRAFHHRNNYVELSGLTIVREGFFRLPISGTTWSKLQITSTNLAVIANISQAAYFRGK